MWLPIYPLPALFYGENMANNVQNIKNCQFHSIWSLTCIITDSRQELNFPDEVVFSGCRGDSSVWFNWTAVSMWWLMREIRNTSFLNKYCNFIYEILFFFSTWNKIIRNDINNLFFYGDIEVKPIYKLRIIRFARMLFLLKYYWPQWHFLFKKSSGN